MLVICSSKTKALQVFSGARVHLLASVSATGQNSENKPGTTPSALNPVPPATNQAETAEGLNQAETAEGLNQAEPNDTATCQVTFCKNVAPQASVSPVQKNDRHGNILN
jgi:hypothetical protein